MLDLQPCPACRRHVHGESCPFCFARLPALAARMRVFGRMSRAMVFSSATLAAAACGAKSKQADEPHLQEQHHGGGGCDDPDPTEIERLERRKAEAETEEEKKAIEHELERARRPMCAPYGAPPRRSRYV